MSSHVRRTLHISTADIKLEVVVNYRLLVRVTCIHNSSKSFIQVAGSLREVSLPSSTLLCPLCPAVDVPCYSLEIYVIDVILNIDLCYEKKFYWNLHRPWRIASNDFTGWTFPIFLLGKRKAMGIFYRQATEPSSVSVPSLFFPIISSSSFFKAAFIYFLSWKMWSSQ